MHTPPNLAEQPTALALDAEQTEKLVDAVIEAIDFDDVAEKASEHIDLSALSQEIDLSALAGEMSASDIASEIDTDAICESVAENLDIDDKVADAVREVLRKVSLSIE